MNRGDRREAIFIDEADRGPSMATLGQACKRPTGKSTPGAS